MINKNDYILISTAIGESYYNLSKMHSTMYSAYTNLQDNEVASIDIEKSLLSDSIFSTYESIGVLLPIEEDIRIYVKKLQKHVVNGTKGSINSFLLDNSIQVTENFAAISSFAGYDIDPGNII